MGLRVELFARIRRDARNEGLSIRELSRRHGVARETVRTALAQAEPPPRKVPVRIASKLEAFKLAIDAMLFEDTTAPRKQRHTARRVFARLADEHGATQLSYSTVRGYVARRRPEIDDPNFGLSFFPDYVVASIGSSYSTGDGACANWFEQNAGLADGGYNDQCHIHSYDPTTVRPLRD